MTAWNACSCAGGTYKKYYNGTTSGTTSNETCTKTPKTVTASANYYVSGTTCPTCSSLSSAYANSDNGNSSGTSACYTSCAAGTRVQTKNAACTTPAGSWYTSAHTVSYGSVSAVNYCMENWTSSSTSASGHDAKTDCTRTIGGGQYVPTTTINARYVRFTGDSTNSVNAYGPHIVEIQAFASADGSGTNLLSGISSNTGSAAATDGSWNTSTYDTGTNVIWDLGATKSLGSIKFAPYVGDGRTYYNIAIAVSTDKSTWTNVMGPIDIVTEGQSTAIPRLIVLSAVPTSCTAGTYKTSATLALGSTSSCTACGDGRYSAAGASSCSNISAGCYGTSASSACPAKCPAGKWSAAGASSCSNCNAGRYGSTEGLTAATCTGACSAGYYCPAGSTSATQNKCSAGNYCPAGSGSQTACPSGYGSSAAGSDAESDCYLTTTAGKYIATKNSSTQSTCTKGYYCPATNIYYGSTGKQTTCPAGSYCPAGSGSATACTSLGSFYTSSAAGSDAATDCYGTTTAGKYIATANSSTQSTCTAGYYCPSATVYYGSTGTRTQCIANSSSAAGSDAISDCLCNTGYSLSNGACVANTYTVAYNANGGSGTTASSSHTYDIAKALTANGFSRTGYSFAGWATSADGGVVYSNKQSVSNLTATNGGTVTLYAVWTANCYTITFDPNGGTTNPQLSSYARTHVYKKYGVEGFYSDSACATTQMQMWEVNRAMAASFYREGYNSWPSTTKISDPITATSTVAAPSWNLSLANEPDGVTSNYTVYANYYKRCATVSNGTCAAAGTSSDSAMTVTYTTTCDTGYEFSSGANTYAPVCSAKSYTCAAGKYLNGASCTTCTAGYYCTGGTWTYNGGIQGRTPCGGNTKYSSSGASSCTTVTSGYYTTGSISTTRTGQTKCEAGNYCTNGVKTACGDGKYSSAGATSCSNISAGCYGTSAETACPAVCGDNTYSDAGASSCSSCPTDYKNSGTTAASHAGSASCKITVTGGYYIGTAGDNSSNWDQCSDGTYKASHTVAYGSTSSCSTCPDGYAGSDGTRAANTSCYAACSAKTITGGSTTVVNAKEYYNGSAYPACTYNVNCKARYGASGNKTSNPACTLCNSTQYSAGGTATCADCSNAPEHAYYSGGPFASSACEWLCKAGYVNRTGNQCAQICTAGFRYLKSSTGVSIPLYTSAQTTHSIVVQSQSGAMCYANLAEGAASGAINVNLNGTTYHAIY